jgi:hypothetical protein
MFPYEFIYWEINKSNTMYLNLSPERFLRALLFIIKGFIRGFNKGKLINKPIKGKTHFLS